MTGGGSVVMATHRSAAATRIESRPHRAAPHHTIPHHTTSHRGYVRVWLACKDGEREERALLTLALLLGCLALPSARQDKVQRATIARQGEMSFSRGWKVEEIGEPRSWFSFEMPR